MFCNLLDVTAFAALGWAYAVRFPPWNSESSRLASVSVGPSAEPVSLLTDTSDRLQVMEAPGVGDALAVAWWMRSGSSLSQAPREEPDLHHDDDDPALDLPKGVATLS